MCTIAWAASEGNVKADGEVNAVSHKPGCITMGRCISTLLPGDLS